VVLGWTNIDSCLSWIGFGSVFVVTLLLQLLHIFTGQQKKLAPNCICLAGQSLYNTQTPPKFVSEIELVFIAKIKQCLPAFISVFVEH
jgi:hypothetical protein